MSNGSVCILGYRSLGWIALMDERRRTCNSMVVNRDHGSSSSRVAKEDLIIEGVRKGAQIVEIELGESGTKTFRDSVRPRGRVRRRRALLYLANLSMCCRRCSELLTTETRVTQPLR